MRVIGQISRVTRQLRCLVYVVFAVLVAYLFIGFNKNINLYDEGLVLYGAMRVLDGDTPYRDFWSIYGPAQFYVLATLFRLFGITVLVTRFFSVAVVLLAAILAYNIMRKLTSPLFALLLAAVVVIQMDAFGFTVSPVPMALMLGLASSLWFIRYLSSRSKVELLYAGLFLGATALFRHDLGGYTLVAQLLVLLGSTLLDPVKRQHWRPGEWAPWVLGTSATFLPLFAHLLVNVPAGVLYDTLIDFPMNVFPDVRWLPYPWPPLWPHVHQRTPIQILGHLQFYVPFLVGGLAVIFLVRQILRKKTTAWGSVRFWSVFYLLLLAILYFGQAAIRSDIYHVLPTMVPTILLIACLFPTPTLLKEVPWPRSTVWVLGLAILCLVANPLSVKRQTLLRDVQGLAVVVGQPALRGMYRFLLPRAQGLVGYPHFAQYEPAIAYVQEQTDPEERIFVGNVFHDTIFVNDVMFYFLAERRSATRYHELHPGLADTAQVQQEIIDELEAHHVQWVILWYAPRYFGAEPNASGQSTDVHLLDRHIRRNFFLQQRFNDYGIYRRR